jgi:hypothetical protein
MACQPNFITADKAREMAADLKHKRDQYFDNYESDPKLDLETNIRKYVDAIILYSLNKDLSSMEDIFVEMRHPNPYSMQIHPTERTNTPIWIKILEELGFRYRLEKGCREEIYPYSNIGGIHICW